MNDSLNRKAIDTLVAAINAGDQAKLDSVLTQDVVIEWPQSKERIGYWSKPFPALEWRAPFVEQME